MKSQHFAFVAVLLAFALGLPAAVAAEGPTPPISGLSGDPSPELTVDPDVEVAGPAAHTSLSTLDISSSTVDAPAVDLGQPGLSFRHMQTFGETERPYLADSDHFYDVSGIGIDGANVWITDSWGDRVLKFDGDGNFLQQIGKAGVSDASGVSLDYVSDVAVDQNGNIWVVDAGAKHIAKYDAAGKHVGELGKVWDGGSDNDQFNDPLSIAFDSAGNIYVSDSGIWGDYGNQRVQVFDSTGAYRATIGVTGVAGADKDHFRNPHRIAIYGDRLYVADSGNHRVQIFDITHADAPSYLATLGTGIQGDLYLQFDFPEGVGVDANYIYVADSNNHRVQIFDRSTLTYQGMRIGEGSWGTDNSHLNYPSDVAVDSAGRIYVADDYNKRVQQFDSSRVYRRTYGTTGVSYVTDGEHYYNPTGIAVTADGDIYIAEQRGHRLVKLNSTGVPQWTAGQAGQAGNDNEHFYGPSAVATDSAGRAYVTESWSNYRVQIFNGDGSYAATLGTGWGSGDYGFKQPEGVAVGTDGTIFVADAGNNRIQIYDSSRQYVGTIGVTGKAGSDNSHLNYPRDVALDDSGALYVADQYNHRIQKCSGAGATWACTTFAGVSGVRGDDLGHLSMPIAVAVDAQTRVYVADQWGGRVQVFDATGAYLTTVGGNWSSRPGQISNAEALAVDAAGNLYVAESTNSQRIQKFAPGVPGWRQVNINGYGDISNANILTLVPFGGQLYAGTSNKGGQGAQLWRMNAAGAWTPVIQDGFGDPVNIGIDHLVEFDGKLYAGTWNQNRSTGATAGSQVWRSSNGVDWSQVVAAGFGDPSNGETYYMAPFKGQLYAATWSYTTTHGTEIWRSSTGSSGEWARVVANGFGDANNAAVMTLEPFGEHLYAGTYNYDQAAMASTGGTVWRTSNGADWTQVNTPGFGSPRLPMISALAAFNGYLYAGTTGPYLVWRCQTCDGSDWQRVSINSGPGTIGGPSGLHVSGSRLYFSIGNADGMEVWRTADGVRWEQVGFAGFGNSNNRNPYYDNAMATLDSHLFVGTQNSNNGGQVWMKTLTADFTATPTRGEPPLMVQFTNTSSGDFTSSQWDFGDGGTSTETSPMHNYTASGTYTVTLTIGDGLDTSSYSDWISVTGRVYLPLVTRHDPLLHEVLSSAGNPALWQATDTTE